VTHVASSNTNSTSAINGETVTSLEKMYEALPKRRKSAPVDPFDSISEPKPKKCKDLGVEPLMNSSAPLFDSYPYFLIDEDLEPTEQPFIGEISDPELNIVKSSRNYPTLPKIPTQIRWDAVNNPYVVQCYPPHFFRSFDSPILENNSSRIHSFDDLQNQPISFSRSNDWETDSILSEISEINGTRSEPNSCEKERKNRNRANNDLENVSSHANGGDLQTLNDMLSSGRSDDGSTSTDAQLLSQASGEVDCANDEEVGDYIWFEQVADLANSI
jgi:hypothetical protein